MQSPSPVLPPRVRPQKRGGGSRRGRFSLRALLLTLTGVAIVLGAMVGLPPAVTLVLGELISLAVFMSVLLGVVHGRGYLRTFCTGGLVAAAYHLLPELISPQQGTDVLLGELAESLLRQQGQAVVSRETSTAIMAFGGTLELLVSVVTLGLFSVWIRRRIERRQSK